MTKDRLKELDFLKCIFIILMVIFHLAYIGDKYPYLKQIVYTFHMSAFLIISGYLVNTGKDCKSFFKGMSWIFIPYVLMETSYVVMSAILPVREKVTDLSLSLLLEKIILYPLGPYWYLHTLILCSVTCYMVYKFVPLGNLSKLIISGLCLFAISYLLGLLSFSNAIYFMAGIALRQSNHLFISIFKPSVLSVIPFGLLCLFPQNLDRGSLGGIAITYLVISFLLYLYKYLPGTLDRISSFIGRNTLVVFLFSPVFTMISRFYVPFFSFDPTDILYTLFTLLFVFTGCFAIAYCLDKLNLSRFIFGKKALNP